MYLVCTMNIHVFRFHKTFILGISIYARFNIRICFGNTTSLDSYNTSGELVVETQQCPFHRPVSVYGKQDSEVFRILHNSDPMVERSNYVLFPRSPFRRIWSEDTIRHKNQIDFHYRLSISQSSLSSSSMIALLLL